MKAKNSADLYAEKVLSGDIAACKHVKNACQRYLNDRLRTDLEFNEARANHVITFVEHFTHPHGILAGERIQLPEWNKFILMNLFGFYVKATSKRRFKTAYIEVPRKNAKTYLAAEIALYGLTYDGKDGAEIYTAATTKDQALICYDTAKDIALKSHILDGKFRKVQYQLTGIRKGSEMGKLKAVSSDDNTLDGLRPHMAIVDEYHAHKTDAVYNVLKSGMGSAVNPILFTITTAGFNKNSPCYRQRRYVQDVLSGTLPNDDSLFGIIYTIDEEDDWRDESSWAKANPNLGVSVDIDFLRDELRQALVSGSKEVNFKTKYLDVWTDAAVAWINDDKFAASGSEFDPSDLYGQECYAGLDLSKTNDMSALTLLFPELDGSFKCLYYFWLPKDKLKDRNSRNYEQYLKWNKRGLIEFTEGETIDHAFIRKKINQLAQEYTIKCIGYDRAYATMLINQLDKEDGFLCAPIGQGFLTMSAPTSDYERLILERKMNHGCNPVIRWMQANVVIEKDAAGNIKPNKAKSEDKIDGVVSNIIALATFAGMTGQNMNQEILIV